MSIYSKLAEARLKVQESGMKETGKNAFAGYTYFELGSILPICNKVCKDLKILPVFGIENGIASLTIYDGESEGKVAFTLPQSEASLKGCHAVQNLGAVQTYLKRYLYQNAFEIAEADALDSTMDPNAGKPAPAKTAPAKTVDFFGTLKKYASENPAAMDLLKERVQKAGWESCKSIPSTEHEKVLSWWPDCVNVAKLGATK